MVRPMPMHTVVDFGPISIALALFFLVSAVVALCAKHAAQRVTDDNARPKLEPKNLITIFSNKATSPFLYKKKVCSNKGGSDDGGFGEGGLWQKTILMGEKCQPPMFPGVIFYDDCGNRVSEPPRSPWRSSPLPSYSSPVTNDDN